MINSDWNFVAIECHFERALVAAGAHAENILINRAGVKGCNSVLVLFVFCIEFFISFFSYLTVLRMHENSPGGFCKLFFFAVFGYSSEGFIHIYISKYAEGSFCSLSRLHS